jgi:hypothetical protein
VAEEKTVQPSEEQQNRRALQSWKEIAAYLGATVRSVQRWEAAGMPVHRQGSGQKARVYAWQDELDAWQAGGGPRPAAEPGEERRAWRWVFPALVAVVAAVGLAWQFGWRGGGRAPARWKLEGSHLAVFDEQGRLCWEKWFGPFHGSYPAEVQEPVLIGDADGDGRRETLVSLLPRDLAGEGGQLACFEEDGTRRWQVRLGAAKTFGKRTFAHSYRGRLTRLVRAGGRPLILTVSNHYLWYPSQVALRDPRTGEVVEEYWHPGAVHLCVVRDLDGDGNDEVLLGGINNPGDGVGHAALAMLRLPFSRAPRQQPDPRWPAATGGGEANYVLFPVPDSLRVTGLMPVLADLQVDPAQRIVALAQYQESSGLVYTLDRDFGVTDCRLSDNYVPIHNRLFGLHLLDHAFSAAESGALCRVARFGAAPDGNSPALGSIWRY